MDLMKEEIEYQNVEELCDKQKYATQGIFHFYE